MAFIFLIRGRLILICGLPGSGKTTLARALLLERNAIRFCPDDWMEAMSLNLWDRIRHRNKEDPPVKREDVTKWFSFFQEPALDELKLFHESYTTTSN